MKNLLELELKNISQIYLGKDDCCRCGCKGTYSNTSYMKNPREEVNDKLCQRRLDKAKKLILNNEGVLTTDETYYNISYGEDRAITIYIDELK